MRPTLGMIVHYTNLGDKDGRYPPEQQAAIITRVRTISPDFSGLEGDVSTVCLHIFYPTGQFDMDNVPYSEDYQRAHWSFIKGE